ncbi:MAG: hypothetical protein ACRC0L_06695, partial [Angustibacter sp.]
ITPLSSTSPTQLNMPSLTNMFAPGAGSAYNYLQANPQAMVATQNNLLEISRHLTLHAERLRVHADKLENAYSQGSSRDQLFEVSAKNLRLLADLIDSLRKTGNAVGQTGGQVEKSQKMFDMISKMAEMALGILSSNPFTQQQMPPTAMGMAKVMDMVLKMVQPILQMLTSDHSGTAGAAANTAGQQAGALLSQAQGAVNSALGGPVVASAAPPTVPATASPQQPPPAQTWTPPGVNYPWQSAPAALGTWEALNPAQATAGTAAAAAGGSGSSGLTYLHPSHGGGGSSSVTASSSPGASGTSLQQEAATYSSHHTGAFSDGLWGGNGSAPDASQSISSTNHTGVPLNPGSGSAPSESNDQGSSTPIAPKPVPPRN